MLEEKLKEAETFLSQWSRPSQRYPVHHGEKSSQPDRIQEDYQLLHMECLSSLELEKRRLMSDDFDPVFVCVDPYDVNPLFTSKATMRDAPSSESRAPAHHAKIKLEMEEFGDLSPFVRTRHASVNSVDELVTPIFDKDAFDFGTNTTTTTSIFLNSNIDNTDKQEQQQQQHQQQQLEVNEEPFVKLERELLASACSFAKRDNPSSDRRQQGNDNNNVHIINNNNNNNNIMFNSNSNATALLFAPYGNISNNAASDSNGRGRLSLNVNVRDVTGTGFDLSTPSIIEEVVDLEAATSGGFKIFNLAEKEDPEGTLDLTSAAPVLAPAPAPPRPIVKQEPAERKRRRRRDQSDDDDEDDDYLPPTPKRARRRARRRDAAAAVDSESEVDSPKAAAQRRSSFSSECSETSKYRELRDKNNEASRRSRLKRKLKELEMESEAEELSSRNVKLKAQVEELEKLVTNFRENLFKMMMAKK